jgi:hypothetical protein
VPARSAGLDVKEADSAVSCVSVAHQLSLDTCVSCLWFPAVPPSPRGVLMARVLPIRGLGVLSAARGGPARTPFGLSVRALAMVVPASTFGVRCL